MALVASVRGYAPPVAVEFARKLLFSDVRPTFDGSRSAPQGQAAAGVTAAIDAMAEGAKPKRGRSSSSSAQEGRAAAHHGGAWKVAYADFVTAMMAFFMVMWLVTAVSKEQRAAIFDYFKNPSMEPGKSVKPAPGQMGPGGASTSPINLGGGLDAPRTIAEHEPTRSAPRS